MKRFISLLLTLLLLSGIAFAESQGDEYDDGYVYEANGAGDQFLKLNIGGLFPLNFGGTIKNGGSLYVGGFANIGYYRFLSRTIAVGGEVNATYNVSVGNKVLVMIPFTVGALIQPTINNFEFPIYLNIGMGYETWQNMNYFPSLALTATPGAFYRINEACSVGISASYMFIPQWFKDSSKNAVGQFMGIGIGARYHF